MKTIQRKEKSRENEISWDPYKLWICHQVFTYQRNKTQ